MRGQRTGADASTGDSGADAGGEDPDAGDGGADAGGEDPDAGGTQEPPPDSGTHDSDAGRPDSGAPDAGPTDAGSPDAGLTFEGTPVTAQTTCGRTAPFFATSQSTGAGRPRAVALSDLNRDGRLDLVFARSGRWP
ncbi:hypothetical protein ACN28S_21460 [Cystobacter fuscus]